MTDIEVVLDTEKCPPGSPAWLRTRQQFIGGSDAYNVVVDPYRVWLDKTRTLSLVEEENEAMRWGHLLEPIVREEFCRHSGVKVEPFPNMVMNPDYSFAAANLDGLVLDDGKVFAIYEGKTSRHDWKDHMPPVRTQMQVIHYFGVISCAEVAYVASLIGGQKLLWTEIERDDAAVGDLMEIEDQFWNTYVIPKVAPPVVSDDVLNKLRRLK